MAATNTTSSSTSRFTPEQLQQNGIALAHHLLLHEKYRRWLRKSLLKEFLQNPVEYVKSYLSGKDKAGNNNNEHDKEAREIAGYALAEIKRFQGILQTHQAMNQAGAVLNTVRAMHLATFIIGNILLLGVVVFILCVLGYQRSEGIETIQNLGIPLASAGGVGVILNILYFVWVGPAVRIRKALSDTAQLEMSYKTYTTVVNNIEKLGDELGLTTYAKLANKPPSFDSLGPAKNKIDYDITKKLLSFKGVMSTKERDTLNALSEKKPYKNAIEELYLKSQLNRGKMAYLGDFTREMVTLIEEKAEPKELKPEDWVSYLQKLKELSKP
jgi:hypothetical protein